MKSMLLFATLGLVACQPRGDVGSIEQDAQVSPEDAQRAFQIVAGVDYIPFAYTFDGCYARALYMSMELAAQRIPSSAQYIEGNLQPNTSVSWRYHVAPMLQVIGDDHQTILDPSLSSQPVSLDDWITLDNPVGNYTLFYVPGSRYVANVDLSNPAEYNQPMIRSFAELPSFVAGDIQNACNVMWSYLDAESPPRDDLQPRLVERTNQLLTALDSVGKLAGWNGNAIACGR